MLKKTDARTSNFIVVLEQIVFARTHGLIHIFLEVISI
jgi:hypothetical protein